MPAALKALQAGIAASGAPLAVEITAAGHAHIDVAWLWPLGQTRRKAARTFYNAIRLSEQFPDFIFTQSQPQLYDFIRQDDPALFAQIQSAVAQGTWEPLGGMWVEADCNLSGGESLARQFLLGRAFFRKYFGEGAESPVLWLPDVFGYAWNLPQLIKEAGLEYFFTIKIGWNQYNRLPYDSFWWQGLDGTRVLTHFSTTPEAPPFSGRLTMPMPRPSRSCRPGPTPCKRIGRTRGVPAPADVVRARGWRWRADPRHAREHHPAGLLPRRAPHPFWQGRRFLPPAGSQHGRPFAHLERRAVPGAAPRHLYHPGAATSAPTASPSLACTMPNSWRPWPARIVPGYAYPAAELARPGSWSASTSSTISSPARASGRSTSNHRNSMPRSSERRTPSARMPSMRSARTWVAMCIANPTSFARRELAFLAGSTRSRCNTRMARPCRPARRGWNVV